jgi:glycosyltransferase involved in cell wall biosynthesis
VPPPKVSVVIPCFNLAEYLAEAIDSVLAQTFQDFEILVVDDGSNDPYTKNKLSVLYQPRVRVFRSENQGPAGARNLAIANARGEYILPLDADDRLGPTFLEQAVAVLDERPEAGIVYSEVEWFGEKDGKWDLPPYRFPDILLDNVIVASALFRRSDWELVGGYGSEFRSVWEDYDFWLSLIERGRVPYRIPEVLFYYRQRGGSRTQRASRVDLAPLYELLFRRHREMYTENIGYLFERIAKLEEELQVREPERPQLQVFVPRDVVYSETDSLQRRLRADVWEKITIDLPAAWEGRLRIDPMNVPGEIEVAELRLLQGDTVVWPESPLDLFEVSGTAALAEGDTARILAWGADPQIYLPRVTAKEPLRLTLELRVNPYSPATVAAASAWAKLWERMRPVEPFDANEALSLQVFFPENQTYSEEHSVYFPLRRDTWQTVLIELPANWRGDLRLDPANGRCCAEIAWVRIEDGERIFWELGLDVNGAVVGGTALRMSNDGPLQIVAWGSDPQIYLPTSNLATEGRKLTLAICLRITHCGLELAMQAESLASIRQRGWKAFAGQARQISAGIASTWRKRPGGSSQR